MSNSSVNAVRSKTAPANSQGSAPRKSSKRRQNKTNPIHHDGSLLKISLPKWFSKVLQIGHPNKWKADLAKWLELEYGQVREPCWPGLRESIRSFEFVDASGSQAKYHFGEIS